MLISTDLRLLAAPTCSNFRRKLQLTLLSRKIVMGIAVCFPVDYHRQFINSVVFGFCDFVSVRIKICYIVGSTYFFAHVISLELGMKVTV
jgi:hypothetical protein